jgi:ATP-dependent DNA helicase PIF1
MQKLKENPETANIGTKWTQEEINDLLEEVKNEMSLEDIALKHKRTLGSINGKLYNIAEHYINKKNMNINEVSKIVNISVIKINEYLLKKLPKKEIKITPIQNEIEPIIVKVIKLNTEQQEALDSFKKGKSIFLTGPAGTGKSVTLKEIIKFCEQENKKFGVTATTGTASFLLSGKTLHSYLGIGLGKESAEEIFKFVRYKLKHVADKLRSLDVLIIDEISMLDKELFEKISEYLCLLRKNSKPFGGLQLVLTGDFCQLEPVNGEYCFLSNVWKRINMETIYLHKLIRQDGDIEFQRMLSKFRYGKCSVYHYQKLLSLANTEFGDVKPTKLYPKNVDVDRINKEEYDKLIKSGAQMIKYDNKLPTVNSKNKEKVEKWVKSLELPESIQLCIGAQVVVLANIDQDAGIVNGTRGVIIDLNKSIVTIKRVDGSYFNIPYYKTTNVEDNTLVVQYMPLKLAYALSIHRSQGQTLDAIEIDIGTKIFAAGQAYTAISRAKDLKSVKIVSVSKNSFIVNEHVKDFYQKIEEELEEKKQKFVKETLNMVIYNLANHINKNNTLDFIWQFIPENNTEMEDFFDEYQYSKLKLDYMNYEVKEEPKEIKTDINRINKLINMVYKTRDIMLYDIDNIKEKIDEFELY